MSTLTVTPKHIYLTRSEFIKAAGLIAGSMTLAACAQKLVNSPTATPIELNQASTKDEFGQTVNAYDDIVHYNNYYEFTTSKEGVAKLAENFSTSLWDVEIYGLVAQPKKYTVEEMVQKFHPEERIYRLCCVEGWSMVIPWVGFPLARLLNEVSPASDAKYVRFESVFQSDEAS